MRTNWSKLGYSIATWPGETVQNSQKLLRLAKIALNDKKIALNDKIDQNRQNYKTRQDYQNSQNRVKWPEWLKCAKVI